MIKCPNCGTENDESTMFCENCGTKIPHEKECPSCHAKVKLTAKFCTECAYNFATSSNTNTSAAGFSVGDKNVIAGDVIGKQETIQVTGSATIIKNEDETKKLVQCHICGKNMPVTESNTCPGCGKITCRECFISSAKICSSCLQQDEQNHIERYFRALQDALADGKITPEERKYLNTLQTQLNLSDEKCAEFEKTAREAIAPGNTVSVHSDYLRGMVEKAYDLLYGEGNAVDALKQIQPLYEKNPDNEELLTIYLLTAIQVVPAKADERLKQLKIDFPGYYFVNIDRDLQMQHIEDAEQHLQKALSLWPENILLLCRKIVVLIEMYQKIRNTSFLDEAKQILQNMANPTNKLENSWHVKAQYVICNADGNHPDAVTEDFCKQHDIYPYLLLGPCRKTDVVDDSGIVWDNDKCKFNITPDGILRSVETENNDFIVSLRIPEKVKELDLCILTNFHYLENLLISEGVKKINWNTISDHTSIPQVKRVWIQAHISKIAPHAFCDHSQKVCLQYIQLPDTLCEISSCAFSCCQELKTINIPASVKSIGDGAFQYSGVENIQLSEGLENIDREAFYNCQNLKTINVPASVKSVGDGAFMGSGLENIQLPDGLENIGSKAFYGCQNLKTINIPATVKRICKDAFSLCEALESAVFLEGLEPLKTAGTAEIGENAFFGCANLSKIIISASVRTIKKWAFSQCKMLETVQLSEGLESISSQAFYNCQNLKTINVPASVKSIGDGAFCYFLENVQLANGLNEIFPGVFSNLHNLKTINIPASVKSIGNGAFSGSGLENIQLPDGLENIDREAFYGCQNLKTINIPATVKCICKDAFSHCEALESVIFQEGLDPLKTAGTAEIGENAFFGCANLSKIIISSSVRAIGGMAFSQCKMLETVQLSEGLTEIKDGAFAACKFAQIKIPSTVRDIGEDAFYACGSLTAVYVKRGFDKNKLKSALPKRGIFEKKVKIMEY